jgi:hypothetical protein
LIFNGLHGVMSQKIEFFVEQIFMKFYTV